MPDFKDLFVYGVVATTGGLYFVLLNRLLRGFLREYLGLVFYIVVLVLTTVMDIALYKSAGRSSYFLVSETLRWGVLYLVVLSFAWKALSAHPSRHWIRHWLVILSILTVAIGLYFTKDERTSIWILKTVNILSVAGMLLNLVLWTVLVRTRSSDLTLFLVTSGLGVQAAIEAVAWSMRNLNSRAVFQAAYYVGISGHLLCLVVWIFAFRRRPEGKSKE
jgi:hypothetical protein